MNYIIAFILILIPSINIIYYKDNPFNFTVIILYLITALILIKLNDNIIMSGLAIGFILLCISFKRRLKRD